MNLLVLPDLNPTDDLVACVPPDDHGVSDSSVVDAVRRADPIAPKCGSSDVDHGAIALLDVLPVPGNCWGADDSTHSCALGIHVTPGRCRRWWPATIAWRCMRWV